MCGIVGMVDLRGRSEMDRGLLSRMNDRQLHRGPDEGGVHLEPGVGLGHRRLSIIDLSSGQQPLYNEDHSVVVVYNGEIYNFPGLSDELQRLGHSFRTHCDTEVIVHAWEEWGADCVHRFRGMFAFALWDRNRQTLFLARDRMGIKPLHYTLLANGHLIFGSELKALLVHPELQRKLDPRAVEDYFAYGYIPEPKTILRDVYKLPAGYRMELNLREPMGRLPDPERYWDIPFEAHPGLSRKQAEEELIERLQEAVRIRMISEVPLGAFLSGGVDSSAVVAMMAEQSQEPINTCSISFGDPSFNESDYAEQVAKQYGARHRVEQVDAHEFSLMDRLGEVYDEPYADSSALPTYRVCELAHQQVTVALSGDGGDENFAGYSRYRWHQAEDRLRLGPLALRQPLFGLMGALYPRGQWLPKPLRARATLRAMSRDSVEGYREIISFLNDSQRQALFSQNLKQDLQGYHAKEVLAGHAANAPTDDPLSKILYLDMKTYLVDDILTKVDRASMAHSLEVRVPLLDHKFVEWASGIPSAWKLHKGEGKHLFKKSLESHLPDDILYRPKQGFAIPVAKWFRGPLKSHLQQRILGPGLLETGLFEEQALKRLVEDHVSGRRDVSMPLWALSMFESFLRRVQVD